MPDDAVATHVETLKKQLDIRLPIRLIMQEMSASPRVDYSVSHGKPRTFVHNLVYLCRGMARFADVSTGQWLSANIASRMDDAHSYTMLHARMMVLLTPMLYIPQAVLGGQLWKWWSSMPEGLVPKFDLMWFALLARCAEMHWAGTVGEALVVTDSAGREGECHNAIVKQLPWLMNKICRTLSLPFSSPAANTLEGKKVQNPPELDRYPIPEEIDAIVMGGQSTWKDVAKFLIYMLEDSPPEQHSDANAWSLFILLQRRMQPFLTPAYAHGEWLWHCMTLLRFLIHSYYQRICRERMLACKTPAAQRLTQAADQKFVALMLPLVRDLMLIKGPYVMVSMENLLRLSQIAALHTPEGSGMEMIEGPSDAFAVDMPSLIFNAAQVLNDPGQADRHVGLLHLCANSLPALMLRMPAALGGLLPITLMGIDPTDAAKTLVSLNLLTAAFSKMPCLNANDWSGGGGGESQKDVEIRAGWRWPVAEGCKLSGSGASAGGVSMMSAMLPNFAIDFVDRLCDYVTRIPKPAKKGAGQLETTSMSVMHGAVCMVAAEVDKATYKQMVEAVAQFVKTTLVPDQAKPAGFLVTAIVRACPEDSLPILMPMLMKKLHKSAGPLHGENGVSDSEAKWFLSMLAATVRVGGAHLLTYKKELEAVVRSALLDERESVTKLGLKVLRRILYSMCSIYVDTDYRVCGTAEWNALIAARLGSAQGSVLAPLAWSGPRPPWWAVDGASPSVTWHIPSEPEVAWARDLAFGAMEQVRQLLATIPVQDLPALPAGQLSGVSWLDGLSNSLPSKRKSSHAAVLASRLAGSVLRGTWELWPDERSEAELKERHLPGNLKIAGDTGKVLFEWFGDVLIATFKALLAQEQPGTTASAEAGTLDPLEVSKVTRKLLKCIGEYLGVLREVHPKGLHLFHRLWLVDIALMNGQQLQSSVMEGLHPHSAWRDTPRMCWVERISEVFSVRVQDRCHGHRFAGKRRALMETMCQASFHSGFSVVRQYALDLLSMSHRFHVGCRWPLVHNVLLPALAKETEAVLQCGSLTGEAADREQLRLNDALASLAAAFGGGIHGLMIGVWRRSIDDASKVVIALLETIYAATQSSRATQGDAGAAGQDQKCEVKSHTVTKLIQAVKHWLDCREAQCWGKVRPRKDIPGMEEGAAESQPIVGMDALEVVGKALDLCGRTDCHWRVQVMATTVSLALLNALGPHGLPPGTSGDDVCRAKQIWSRWGQWLVKCCDPQVQPGLHTLATHGLQLLLKRPAPLDDKDLSGIGLCETSFMDKLLVLMPPLHHESLTNAGDAQTGQNLEPTRDAVSVMTSQHVFRLWPRTWIGKSSKSFSLRNVHFWQSYFRFQSKSMSAETMVKLVCDAVEHLASQPTSEPEFHATLAELAAGCLRALRKSDGSCSSLRRQVWTRLRSSFLAELQRSSQDRLEDWCDAVRFIVAGCQRPLLKAEPSAPAVEDQHFLIPLFNFIVGGEGEMSFDALSCTMPPIQYNQDDKDKTSFDVYKRLRLLMSLLVEPSATAFIQTDVKFCNSLAVLLRPGLGHPYKQLREEMARGIYLLLRAAGTGSGASDGLAMAAVEIEDWLVAETQRLLPLLRADNAAHQKESEDDSRPQHVVESSGLCYAWLHTALARRTSFCLGKAAPASFKFLLAAAAHGDFELRVLAAHALSLCCLAHPIGPDAAQSCRWEAMPMANALCQAISVADAVSDKELEKALASALKQVMMANYFLLRVGDRSTESIFGKIRTAAEQALGHSKPEVRSATRGAVVSFLSLDSETQITTQIKSFKKLAGPPRKPTSSEVIVLDSENSILQGVNSLVCVLLAAADRGVPSWTGKAVQAVAPYGRPGLPEAARKEVQGAIQAFLKLQQSSQRNWKEFQDKMTPTQMELLDDNKGKLSYFS
jgi:hypothetical protein